MVNATPKKAKAVHKDAARTRVATNQVNDQRQAWACGLEPNSSLRTLH